MEFYKQILGSHESVLLCGREIKPKLYLGEVFMSHFGFIFRAAFLKAALIFVQRFL